MVAVVEEECEQEQASDQGLHVGAFPPLHTVQRHETLQSADVVLEEAREEPEADPEHPQQQVGHQPHYNNQAEPNQ